MKEMKIDDKTREYLKKWHRNEVPTAQVTGGDVTPGIYRGLACLGWFERRGPFAICGVHFVLMHNQADKAFATLSLALPVTKNTELLVNSFLHLVGWDGRVWPYDADGGWPEKTEDEEQVRTMLDKLKPRISATLTFPPSGRGATCLNLPVVKRSSPYPLAPFEPVPDDQETPIVHINRFRELCLDPSPFTPAN
jgi:hypothetical protein